MCSRPRDLLLTLAAFCLFGCGEEADNPADSSLTLPAYATSRPKVATHLPIEGAPALSEEMLLAFEDKYSCRLPDDYRQFLLESNGGFPSPDCVNFEEAGQQTESDVFCFFAIDDERAWASVEWHIATFSGRLPKESIPIARDSCGNLWLMSIADDQAGSVYFWDHGSFDTFDETDLANWPHVATSFTEFRDNLTAYASPSEKNGVPSRYDLVKLATADMAKRNAGFSTQANPDFVWNCSCDEDGNVTLEFVKYEVHANVTHTDGYSRLRAINKLIEEGPTRIPK